MCRKLLGRSHGFEPVRVQATDFQGFGSVPQVKAGAVVLAGVGRNFNAATPLTFIQYALYYGEQKRIGLWLWSGAGLSSLALLAPLALFLKPAKRSLHGDARFASSSEIRKAGLTGKKGIIVGKRGSEYLMFDGPQHVLLSAPTRSGKGVSVVIPNLLTWPESCVVLDIKRENWDITSAYRRKYGQRCYLFNPGATDARTHRYNPLGYISEDAGKRIDDIQKIANMIFPDLQGTDPIWTATPRSLFLGVVLYLLESPGKPVTLGQVLRETLCMPAGTAVQVGGLFADGEHVQHGPASFR